MATESVVNTTTNQQDDESDVEEFSLQTYKRRWFVLVIVCSAISLRGYNQSCYGPINYVYSEYFGVYPWQVDWLIVIQSVVFLAMSLPVALLTIGIGYKWSVITMTLTLTLGFILTTVGVAWTKGYGLMMLGQAIMGFSNIVSWSIPPATAAIWFPENEVATAVALQVVGRGIGEAVGSCLPTILFENRKSKNERKAMLLYMFGGLSSVALLLTILSIFVVKNSPPTPPSIAQAKRIQSRSREEKHNLKSTFQQFKRVVVSLFSSRLFIAVWFIFGAINPILRNNNILLTSILRKNFSNSTVINKVSGLVLLVAWLLYTVGGFIAGPILTKTKLYKGIVVVSVGFMFVSCSVLLIAIQLKYIVLSYVAVAAQGLFIGIANTSLFELLAEITYPTSPMFVTMIAIVILGFFRLIFPLIGRLMLIMLGPTFSTCFPVLITLLCFIIVVLIKPEYKRTEANQNFEEIALLTTDEDSS